MNMKKCLVSLFVLLSFYQLCAQSYVPELPNSRVKVNPVVDMQAYAFHLSEVQLLESPFKQAEQADLRYLLLLQPDSLLSQFRTHAGLKPKAQKYGGWESSGLAGHTLGHYLSACAMHYAVSKDPEYLKRVNYIVDQLEECQVARKTGYIGAIPREDSVFMEVSQGNIRSRGFDLNGAWSPWYTIHKVMSGLLDAYLYCNNDKALKVEQGMADWAEGILKNLNDEQIQKMLLCEYGGMNDVLVNTYAFTGNKKYLDLSYKFHDKRILDSLALGVDVLPGKHSNTQVPKAIGTARRYEVTGDKQDLATAEFFWNTVVNHHTYAPGGNSNYEYLSKRDELSNKLTDNTMETCNTYNMLKLTRHLFALQPSVNYMDFYERALYNHILASQNRKNGMMCYFVPLRMGTQKDFSDEYHSFTCCVGSGIENHVKYGENIYNKGKDGSLYVNLFIPSQLNWKEKEFQVTLNSNLPMDPKVTLTVNSKKAQSLPIRIRKPYWVQENVTVKVNANVVASSVDKQGYIVLERKWKQGDVIELTFPSNLYIMPTPDNASRQAFFYGPILLAANLGTSEPDPMNGTPVLVTDENDVKKWIRQDAADPLTFTTVKTGVQQEVKLQPFYLLDNEYYSVYLDVFSKQAWKEQQVVYEERKRKEYEREKSTVDVLRVGEMQPERDHNLTGEKTETGESHTRKYRVAHGGGNFSFDMKVIPGFSYVLVATYWGMDNRGRTFDILVDGEKIVTEDINKYKESRFYDIEYRIPSKLTNGKERIHITFQAKPRNNAGPVYGVRLVKEASVTEIDK
jgi:uncharacterized protein